jgi:hypothetical protein
MVFAFVANGLALLLVVAACRHLFRERKRRAQKGRGELMVSRMAGLAMGAMLLGFQAIVQPEARHMLVEEQKEDSVDDRNDGGEPLGGRMFHEQLRRIRRGEEVQGVTVRVEGLEAEENEGAD